MVRAQKEVHRSLMANALSPYYPARVPLQIIIIGIRTVRESSHILTCLVQTAPGCSMRGHQRYTLISFRISLRL